MLIVCPTCATSYTVSAPSLGLSGRTVRCARCQTTWYATPTRGDMPSAIVDELIAEASARNKLPPQQNSPPGSPLPRSTVQKMPPANMPPPAAPSLPPTMPQAVGPSFTPTASPLAMTWPSSETSPPEQISGALDNTSNVRPDTADGVTIHEHNLDDDGLNGSPTIDAGDAPLVPQPQPQAEEEGIDAEEFVARRKARIAAQKRRRRAIQVPAVVICLGMIAGALIVWRHDLVRHLPQTASLFSVMGMPVNLRNLTFEDVAVSKETHDGIVVLVIEGKIVSVVNKPTEVPRLRFAVRNSTGNEIYSWTAQAPRSVLGPGESVAFRSRLASPPAEAQDVLVRFFSSRDLPGGK